MLNKVNAKSLIKFFGLSQKLKLTPRHSWTEDVKRQESVAEHSWHLALMAIMLESYLRKKVDLLRVLKLVAIHDLGEFFKGDVPAFKKKQRDSQIEEKAVRNISKLLAPKIKKELISLWIEYEAKKTPEAIFVKMLDVLDVLNQHLIANISTWSPIEMEFNLDRQQEKFFIKEPEILDIYNEINKALVLKVGCYQKNRKRNRIK